jgi:hypothetical protein
MIKLQVVHVSRHPQRHRFLPVCGLVKTRNESFNFVVEQEKETSSQKLVSFSYSLLSEYPGIQMMKAIISVWRCHGPLMASWIGSQSSHRGSIVAVACQ